MVLLTAPPSREEQRYIGIPAPPIQSPTPAPSPAEWGNFGAAIGVCILVGNKLLGLFTQQQSTEAQMMLKYMETADKREERYLRLIEALVQRNP